MSRPLSIAVASSGLGHVNRGIEAWAADLGRALAGRGEDVTLFKGGGRAEQPYEVVVPCWQREQARTRRLLARMPSWLGWRVGLGSGYAVEQTTFALRLLDHLRRRRFDVLHVQDPFVALLVQRAGRLGWVKTRPILAHGTEEPLAFQKRVRYLQHLAPHHQHEAEAAGVGRPTWTAIPNFIDTDRFRTGRSDGLRAELGLPTDALVVLTAAAIKRGHKRIDHLVGEFARLRRERPELPVYLVVAGGWEAETDQLIAESSALLGDRVRFLVRFPRERMAELYRAADVFALCSLKEMMPIALLEATASGLPCVVHKYAVMEWIVGAGGEALDMATPGALADAMARMLADPTRRAALGRAAREQCVAEFGENRVVERILDYYRLVAFHDRPTAVSRERPLLAAR